MTVPDRFSREERALFNPAFMALVSCRVVQGHQQRHGPCPLPVAVTAAVMALQPGIRVQLPKNTHASLPKWLEEQPSVRVLMKANATSLADMVRPGILLAAQANLLNFDEEGLLSLRHKAIPKSITGRSATFVAIQRSAQWLGRWLPANGNPTTTLTLLGVRP